MDWYDHVGPQEHMCRWCLRSDYDNDPFGRGPTATNSSRLPVEERVLPHAVDATTDSLQRLPVVGTVRCDAKSVGKPEAIQVVQRVIG